MGDVQNSIAVGKARRNPCKPCWFTTNMIVVYAFPVIEETITSTSGKLKSVRSPRCRRMS